MKKLCCSLLLLLSIFVCLFATIPKNKVSADSIIQNSTYDFPYLMPTIINYSFGSFKVSTTPDLIYSYNDNAYTLNSSSNYLYENQDLIYSFNTSTSSSLIDSNLDLADYWGKYDNSKDSIYNFQQQFLTFPSSATGDLVINLVFTNVLLNYEFIVDYSDTDLLMFTLPFRNNNYNIDLDFNVTYPNSPYYYINANGNEHRGSSYDTFELDGTINDYFGYTNPISLDIIKMLDLENRDIYDNSDIPILVSGSLKITIPNWRSAMVDDVLNFSFNTIAHSFSSYQEYPEKAIGLYPGPEFYNFDYLPFGLPSGSNGGACEDSGFIEDISTSLLNGVQNFLAFEISPGFSLYHILLLIVAIPLLILILKLFLGG